MSVLRWWWIIRVVEKTNNFELSGTKGLAKFFVPLLLVSFSNFVFFLVEKLFLARLSVEMMEAAVTTAYICQVFIQPTVAIAMMTQVYVGRWIGSGDLRTVGPGVWQMIWLSIFSMVITVPGSLLYGSYFFSGSSLEEVARPYFYFQVGINFLFPLLATLSCFFIAVKKTYFFFLLVFFSQIVKLALGYVLILGLEGWVPSLGIIGGAISTLIAQGGVCCILLLIFMSKKYSQLYNSRDWGLKLSFMWSCFHPGSLRALSRLLNIFSWASISHLMIARGGDYTLVLSIGGTLFLFLPFISDALLQAQLTVVSHILGARDYHLMSRALRSGMILSLVAIFITGVPLVLFSVPVFNYLFQAIVLEEQVIQNIFLGVWLSFAFFTIVYVPVSFVLSFKDTKFSLFMGGMNWINGYLLMYVMLEVFAIQAEYFWIALTLMHGTTYVLYYLRMRWLQLKVLSGQQQVLAST